MTVHLSNLQETDSEHEKQHTEEDRKGDSMLLVAILVLLAGVGGYLILNPDESTLRKGTAFKEPITNPVPRAPVALTPATPEPATPEPATPDPVTPEPVSPEPVSPEPVMPEPVTPDPVMPEPVTPDPVMPEPVTPAPVMPEPVMPESVMPEPVTPAPVEPAAPAPAASHTDLTENNKATFAWAVNLASVTSQSSAEKVVEQLKAEGIETEVITVNVKGRTYYRIRIPNLTSKQEANGAKTAFKDKPAYKDAWINRYPTN